MSVPIFLLLFLLHSTRGTFIYEYGKDSPDSSVLVYKEGEMEPLEKIRREDLKVHDCMVVDYVQVKVENEISVPTVQYKEETRTVVIVHSLLPFHSLSYTILAKGHGCTKPWNKNEPQDPIHARTSYSDLPYDTDLIRNRASSEVSIVPISDRYDHSDEEPVRCKGRPMVAQPGYQGRAKQMPDDSPVLVTGYHSGHHNRVLDGVVLNNQVILPISTYPGFYYDSDVVHVTHENSKMARYLNSRYRDYLNRELSNKPVSTDPGIQNLNLSNVDVNQTVSENIDHKVQSKTADTVLDYHDRDTTKNDKNKQEPSSNPKVASKQVHFDSHFEDIVDRVSRNNPSLDLDSNNNSNSEAVDQKANNDSVVFSLSTKKKKYRKSRNSARNVPLSKGSVPVKSDDFSGRYSDIPAADVLKIPVILTIPAKTRGRNSPTVDELLTRVPFIIPIQSN